VTGAPSESRATGNAGGLVAGGERDRDEGEEEELRDAWWLVAPIA
jgi:hypothetical protein